MAWYLDRELGEDLQLLLPGAEGQAQRDRGPGDEPHAHLVIQLSHVELNLHDGIENFS